MIADALRDSRPEYFRHWSSMGKTMTAQGVHYVAVEADRVEYLITVHAGRSFRRHLRVRDAVELLLHWQPRSDTVVLPFISNEEAERKFASGVGLSKERAYLHFVRDPPLRIL